MTGVYKKKQRTARRYYLSIHCLNLFQDIKELTDIRAEGRAHGNLLVPGDPAAAALWGRAIANAFLSLSVMTFPFFSRHYILQVLHFSDIVFCSDDILQIWYFHATLLFLQVILCQCWDSGALLEEKGGKKTRTETEEQDLWRNTAKTAET